MLARSFCRRQVCTVGWYRARVEYFSTDKQQGTVCLSERLCANSSVPFLELFADTHREPLRNSPGAAATLLVCDATAASMPELGKGSFQKLPFTSHAVYAASQTPAVAPTRSLAEMEKDMLEMSCLYPCYMACGCPLVAHVAAMGAGGTPSTQLVRLFVPPQRDAAGALTGHRVWYHPLPKAVFDLWERHGGGAGWAGDEGRRGLSRAADVDVHGDVDQAEMEVLAMMGLSLSELVLHGPEPRGDVAGCGNGDTADSTIPAATLEDVGGISM